MSLVEIFTSVILAGGIGLVVLWLQPRMEEREYQKHKED